ncbi:NOB1 family endonuclease [Candidatus Nanohalovita haloferacivicina]|uniref:NOB1 family endonuclease n=1 Tax=Candidatus Nanohalovita haloferacivicina TaxID=2978046 RepID=UPI00325FBD5B
MVVVDANVIIHGRADQRFSQAFTVPEVLEEMKSSEASMKADLLDLQVQRPDSEIFEQVQSKSEEIGAATSETDEKLLALALTRKDSLVTDDKDLQNLGLHLEAEVEGFLEDRIEKKLQWISVCSNCGREVSTPPCPRCGSQQVRRKLD